MAQYLCSGGTPFCENPFPAKKCAHVYHYVLFHVLNWLSCNHTFHAILEGFLDQILNFKCILMKDYYNIKK